MASAANMGDTALTVRDIFCEYMGRSSYFGDGVVVFSRTISRMGGIIDTPGLFESVIGGL
jgi:hypothetical protein